MPQQTIKILSWNIDTLNILTRFQYAPPAGMPPYSVDGTVLDYIAEVIGVQNPDIVCILEMDTRTQERILNGLKARLDESNWDFNVSLPVHGGAPDPTVGAVVANEIYVVISKKTSFRVLHTGAFSPKPQLVTNTITITAADPTTGAPAVTASLKRPAYVLSFCTPGPVDKNPVLTLVVVHLEAFGGSPDLQVLTDLLRNIPLSPPVVIAGDFNQTYNRILGIYAGNLQEVIGSIADVRVPASAQPKASVLQPYSANLHGMANGTIPVPRNLVPPTSPFFYRQLRSSAPDDIVILNNAHPVQPPFNIPLAPLPAPPLPPPLNNSGILDLVNALFLGNTSNDFTVFPGFYLQQLPPNSLVTDPGGRRQQDYGVTLFGAPANPTELLYNCWARYRGGISDHLPVIMTVDIDI